MTVDSWRCMFDDEEYLESRVFPPIHKISSGLRRADLRQHLELSSSNIDDTDVDGRTALSWAAAKTDAKAVGILLEFGANPNIISQRGHGPLSWAAQSQELGRREVIEKLLAFNADANWADKSNRTSLINSASDVDDPECLRLLIHHGPDINWQDCHRGTAVCYASKMNRKANLRYLLETGADYSIPDHWGHTPHIEATYQNHHAVLEVLLAKDPLLSPSRLADGGTVFHVAAARADAETFLLLADKADLSLIGADELDNDGRSFRDVFETRDLLTEELRMAFKRFCQGLGKEIPCTDLMDPNDSENEFVDTLEQQAGGFQQHLELV